LQQVFPGVTPNCYSEKICYNRSDRSKCADVFVILYGSTQPKLYI